MVQVETRQGLDALKEIAGVEDAIRHIVAAGKPAGLLTADQAFAERCIAIGTSFTAVGIDAGLLARAADALVRRGKPACAAFD